MKVHRRRKKSHLDQEDLRDARDLVVVLRVPIHRRFSSRVHRFTSHALRLEQPPDRVRHLIRIAAVFSHSTFY